MTLYTLKFCAMGISSPALLSLAANVTAFLSLLRHWSSSQPTHITSIWPSTPRVFTRQFAIGGHTLLELVAGTCPLAPYPRREVNGNFKKMYPFETLAHLQKIHKITYTRG
jgi:hypothetical protein